MRKLLLLAVALLLQITAFSQNPKREVRAAWLTTIFGTDWPKSTNQTTQKNDMIAILNSYEELNINTIYFQVRGASDAMYKSSFIPWSNLLTGTYGLAPANNFDPLQFVIDEGHKRGMEVHAWLNPYRAATSVTQLNSHVANHPAKLNPAWVIDNVVVNAQGVVTSSVFYFNPGLTEVRTHITDVVNEIVDNYDIDGIHFDDYFYQANLIKYQQTNPQDKPTYDNYVGLGGTETLENWRRSNITSLISTTNASIKSRKPWVKFGVSPSGIYRSKTTQYPEGSETGTGTMQHYNSHYADTKAWLEQSLLDYLTPQIYWFIGQTNSDFSKLTQWWNGINTTKHITVGIAAYKVGDASQGAFNTNTNEISQQINLIRGTSNLKGAAYYNTATLNANKNNFRTNLINNQYSTLSLPPIMTWIDNVAPAEPTNLTPTLVAGKTQLSWTAPASTTDELQKVVRYAVYRSTSATIDYNNSANLIAVVPSTAVTYTDNAVTPGNGISYYYAVTSLDRISNESTASNVVPDAVTLPVKLINFAAKKDNNRVKVEWSTASETNSDYFLIEKAGADGVFKYLDKQNSSTENTTTIKNYVTIDNNPFNGTNYYRLIQFDKNGDVSKPAFAAVDFNELILVSAKAFPNPTQKEINFSLENFEGRSIKTRLVNLYGQVVHEEEFHTQSGTSQYQLGIKNELPKGHYILTLSDQKFKKNIKLIVL